MSSKMFRKSMLVNCILLSCFGLSSVYAVNNENDVYKAPTQGKTTLLMMLDSSSAMDDDGKGSKPNRSIFEDYPSCRGYNLLEVATSTLDSWYPLQTLNNGTQRSTFAYGIPYCNLSGYRSGWFGLTENQPVSIDNMASSRMDRMKMAMSRLLGQTGENGVSSNIVMGLGQFPTHSSATYALDATKTARDSANAPDSRNYFSRYAKSRGYGHIEGNDISAKITIPASPLDGDQRYKMRVAVTTMGSGGAAPIGSALAESGAYMLGSTTLNDNGNSPGQGIPRFNTNDRGFAAQLGPYEYSGFKQSATATKQGNQYKAPIPADTQQCNANGIFLVTSGIPSDTLRDRTVPAENVRNAIEAMMKNALKDQSFTCASDDPNGIKAVGSGTSDYGWTCMAKFTQELRQRNIKVSLAGFGNYFIPYLTDGMVDTVTMSDGSQRKVYNCNALQANRDYVYTPYNTTTPQTYRIAPERLQDVKNACNLANFTSGYGEGGFYPILSEYHLSDAVNQFVSFLNTTIPSTGAATPTVPYDTLNNTQQLSSVYYAQFQPDIRTGQNIGIWLGNIKKYWIDSNGFYKDKNNNTVLDSNGNLISSQDYWNTTGNDDANTQKGGALSQLPVPNRTIYRESDSNDNKLQSSLVARDLQSRANDTTQTIEVRLTAKYLLNLMGYSIPVESSGTQRIATVTNDQLSRGPFLRQMGASLHSSPVFFTTEAKLCLTAQTNSACSNGQDANGIEKPKKDYYDRKDFILFGTMQGLIQVVNANTGVEAFSFLPDAIVSSQQNGFVAKSLQTGNEYNSLYQGMDAPWTVYTSYETGSTTQSIKASTLNVYGGMRRGGNNYYGLDLSTNDGSSFTPKRLFTIAPSGNCSASNPKGCMGQSWSKPAIGWIKWKGKPQLVMIVGGGYDTNFDDPKYQTSTATKGNGVYIFAAKSNSDSNVNAGDLLWWASSSATDVITGTNTPYAKNNRDLKYSVVSEIKTVDRDSDGFIDNLYFGDLGGQIFRVDINNVDSSERNSIVVPNVVRLTDFSQSGKVAPRFYNMPTFTVHNKSSLNRVGNTANFYGVLSIGSGDVSSPSQFSGNNIAITDKVYGIFDRDVGRSDLYTATNLQSLITLESLTNLASSFSSDSMKSSSGWYDELTGSSYSSSTSSIVSQDANQLTRYKVLNGSSALKNTLFMSYYDAADSGSSGACQAGIKGRTYLKTYCLPYVRKVDGNFVCDGTGGGTGRNYSQGVGLDLGSGIQPLVVNGYQSNGTNTIGPITPNGNTNAAKYSMSLKFVSKNWYEE